MRMYRVVSFCVMLLSSALFASPQWLHYRATGREARMNGGSRFHRPIKDVSIDVPKLASKSPLFIQWSTPMDPAGFRYAVFDRTNKYGLCNVLYFDTNGNRRLDDDPKIEGIQVNEYEAEFWQVPVQFDSPDGPITYHLNLRFYSYNEESTYVYAYAGCRYEGEVAINGQKQRCVLIDNNVNGTFNDKSDDFNNDQIRIGPDEGSVTAAVGNYLEYKDALYRVEIAQDGAFVDLNPAPDVAYGTVQLPKTITEFTAGGMNGVYTRQVKDGQIRLPEGRYRISEWSIKRKDEQGTEWTLRGYNPQKDDQFTVSKDASADLKAIGEPVFANLSTSENEQSIYINQRMTGQLGESISINKDGKQAPAPRLNIRDKTGRYDRTFALEYG